MRHRLLQPARVRQAVGQVMLRAFIVRLQLKRGAELSHRRLGLSLRLQGQPQVMVGLAGIRVQPQRLLVIGDRLGRFPRIHQGIGQVEVIEIFGLEPDRGRIVREGLIETSLPQQHGAEIVVRLGVIRLGASARLHNASLPPPVCPAGCRDSPGCNAPCNCPRTAAIIRWKRVSLFCPPGNLLPRQDHAGRQHHRGRDPQPPAGLAQPCHAAAPVRQPPQASAMKMPISGM